MQGTYIPKTKQNFPSWYAVQRKKHFKLKVITLNVKCQFVEHPSHIF